MANYNKVVYGYAEQVLNGKILASKYTQLACKRFFDDLDKAKDKGFYLDHAAGQFVLDVVQLMNFWKGSSARANIILEPHQQFHFYNQFGWKSTETGLRRFGKSYKEVARKNGKTTECATKGLIATKFLNVAGAQVYSVATKEEQAKIVFSDAANIIKATKSMYSEKRKLFKIFAKSIVDESSNSFFRPLGSDSDTQDGFDPYYAIIDEYHAHTNDKMLNVIESGMGARPDPMVDIITTAGFNREGPCAKFRQIITNILDGVIENESIFGIIYTIDNESDWQDLEKVPMANPNYGVSVYPDYFKKRLLEAQQQGDEKEVDYKTKNLNIWTDSAQVWIQDEIWMQAADMIEMANGSICYGGLDVAVTEDLTSFSLQFPIGEKVYWKQWAWTHEEKYKELQRIGISSVVEWRKRGILKVCDGNTIDLDEVFDFIMELYSQYQIQAIAADRAYSGNMLNALNKEGVPTYEFSQSPKNLTQYIRQVSTSIKSKTLHHGGDPLLRWMASNVQVVVSGNNLMVTKQKGNKNSKIDGIMSGIFATACHALVPLLEKSEPTVEVW